MAITVKIKLSSSTAGNTVVFAETSAGHFTTAITGTTAVSVTSTGKPLRAAAVSTRAGYYISSWYGEHEEDENLASWTSSKSTECYPNYSYTTTNGPAVTVVDDHGTHLGTPTGVGYYKSGNCIGVMHSTTDSGWTFAGWTISLTSSSEGSSYGTMLSSGGTKSDSTYTFGETSEAIVFQLGTSSLRTVTITANYTSSGSDEYPDLALPFCLTEAAVGKLVLFGGGCHYDTSSTPGYEAAFDQYVDRTTSKVFSASTDKWSYLAVSPVQVVPLERNPNIVFYSGTLFAWHNWSAWAICYGKAPDGTAISVDISVNAYGTSKVPVTIQDEHGRHLGTQNCTNAEFYAQSAIGVMHTSSDDGWKFTGWRLKGDSPTLSPYPAETYWTKVSSTEWFLPASVKAAVCHTLTAAISITAEYEQAAVAEVSWVSGGEVFATTSCTDGETYVMPSEDPTKSGYDFQGWFTEASGGEQVTQDTTFTTSSATTLFAQWKKSSSPSPSGGGTGLMVRSAKSDFLVFSVNGGFLVYDA